MRCGSGLWPLPVKRCILNPGNSGRSRGGSGEISHKSSGSTLCRGDGDAGVGVFMRRHPTSLKI